MVKSALKFAFVLASVVLVLSQSGAAEKKKGPPKFEPQPINAGTDPKLKDQWHLEAIGQPAALKLIKNKKPVLVSVIDSGIEYNHPEIQDNIFIKESEKSPIRKDHDGNGFVNDWIGWNFGEENNLPFDDNGHGTLIAGIIAGVANNSYGGMGVCPFCKIMPIRFLDEDGYGDTEDSIRGIYYAANNGAKVLNLSFAGEGVDYDLRKALVYAGSKDVVIIVAAGNYEWNNDNHDVYPANFKLPYMMTVAAVKKDFNLLARSAWGIKKVTIGAPGNLIWGPYLNKTWDQGNGTSLAAPVVAGAAALVRAANPSLKADVVVAILESTVQHVESLEKKIKTGGVVDAEAAVACAIDPKLSCLQQVE